MLQESMYDVTDYEECNTEHTPLTHLTTLDTECLGKTTTTHFFENKMIQNWISSKIKSSFSALVVWIISRIFFLVIFIVFDMRLASFEEETFLQSKYNLNSNGTNVSSSSEAFMTNNRLTSCLLRHYHVSLFDYFCAVYILSSCLFRILSGSYVTVKSVIWLLGHNPYMCYPHRRKSPICEQGLVYILTAFNASISAIFFTILKILRLKLTISISFFYDDFTYFSVLLCIAVEFLLICQVLPKVGSFPMIINRLFGDLYSFLAILILFSAPFVMAMQHIINRREIECTPHFRNSVDSFYSMFLAMNNMLNIEKLVEGLELEESVTTLYFLHFFFVFSVSILLLNFLIALFSHSVAKTMEHEKIMVSLNTLNILLYLEKLLSGILGWWFKIMRRKCFTYRDGRLFVTCVKIQKPSKNFV